MNTIEHRLQILEDEVRRLRTISYLILGALIGSGALQITEWCL